MKYFLLLTFIFLINSCSQIDKRGYSFELSDQHLLKEDIHSKDDVMKFMGYPSFFSQIDGEEVWVYVSEDVRRFMFFRPKILNRQITTIDFSKQNIIEEIHNYDLEDQNILSFDKNYTKVASPKKSWWSKIFGNIGQVRAVN
ncbi:MAG: outer membrane protein assembly factor BamE (lipoprotein component of BamABCDE complex) [Lentimonas sp.]|jgi:outer membrane protein assembly factor BamE (lipoprotein component of BamABCDE complex)